MTQTIPFMTNDVRAIRGAMLNFSADPFVAEDPAHCWRYESDAIVVMSAGKITAVGPATQLLPTLGDVPLSTYPHGLILPGFIDAHVHYAQIPMVAAYGQQLIDWLNRYTFVTEQRFTDAEFARAVAKVFLREQWRHGVTSSVVYGTVYPQSVDVLFEEASKHNMRIMAGKVCMDRNAPTPLLDTAQSAYDDSKQLIERWHGQGRSEYVITPRFAPTSSPAQLHLLGQLAAEYPDVLIQSHVSENRGEVAWVSELFADLPDYTAVYEHYGLLRARSIYGHGIHLSERELRAFHDRNAAIAHCPTSNFFLGSGSFNVLHAKSKHRPVHVALATDLGAGTSFSMLQTMNEAYKAAQVCGTPYPAPYYFYLATLGAAKALGLANKIGRIDVGMEADLVVLNTHATPYLDYRLSFADSLEELLFVLMMLGDDRTVAETYVAGVPLKGSEVQAA
ncbi:guanine deaminase [Snodgrassella sp. CFCC 13594]|uniref:guanine deaminase n=1 Tax=Snodgrassella sp. CFCC 13594 TaxID=1775559 RepID=UPI000B224965|nr:guanine deaminase [Snodgrassella sp. CFCC 13594]